MSSQVEFHVIADGAYTRVPYAGRRKSNYVDLPNTHWDPIDGQHALEMQLEMLVEAERMGFDGAIVSEQHNGPIGQLGNPMLAGAWLAGQTSRIKIGVVGAIINDYLTPIRLAEEIALVDMLSKGRVIVGLPLGHGMQHHSIGRINPATARARYNEAHELLIAALTRPGPFEWNGEFFNIPYVNLWPRPLQTPHPPIILVGGGSSETLELATKHGYGYLSALNNRSSVKKAAGRLEELAEQQGRTLDRKQVIIGIDVHVAETDAQAVQEAEAHRLWVNQNFFRSVNHDNFPPGYLSSASLRGVLAGGYRSRPVEEVTFEEEMDGSYSFVGSPETVTAGITQALEEVDPGRVILSFHSGTMPRWLALKSMGLFAEEVLPRLRGGAGPIQHAMPGFHSAAEYGARRDRSTPPPTYVKDGQLYDVETAHIPELRKPLGDWPPK
ncbi:LLM class flavin-dependent oxidoreductase [Streptomyces sp. NPDC006356]